MQRRLGPALLLLGLLPLPAVGAPRPEAPAAKAATAMVAPEIRTRDHPGFGQLVFDFPGRVDYALQRDGNRVLLRFKTPTVIGDLGAPPRNMLGLTAHDGLVEITLAPGAGFHPARLGNLIVLDAIDPPGRHSEPAPSIAKEPVATATVSARPMARQDAATPTPAAEAKTAESARARREPAREAAAPSHHSPVSPDHAHAPDPAPLVAGPATAARPASAPSVPRPEAAGKPAAATPAPVATPASDERASDPPGAVAPPAAAPAPADSVMQLAARLVPQEPGSPVSAVFLPFAADSGAGAFRRGENAVLVFDRRVPLDLSALHDDPVFGSATIQLLAAATELTMRLPAASELRLAHGTSGWTLTAGPAAMPIRPIAAEAQGPALKFAADGAAQVVVVPDPETGQNLLVGTQKKPGQGIGTPRRAPQFSLYASWQGVVVEPVSDRVALHAQADGFLLDVHGKPLALSASEGMVDVAAAADRLTRRYDFPDLPATALLQRLQAQVLAAADGPAQSRAAPRRDAAEAMVALGMGAEAQSLIRLAAEQDPQAATPDLAGLAAIAALLAGRVEDSQAIDDPALTGTDEVALWRAVRAATLQPGQPEAAATFANTLPLAIAYPAALRARILPVAAETMALGGAAPAAQGLVASRKDDPTLGFARGLLLAGKNDTAGALAVFDALAQGRDRLTAARAAERAVELRLAAQKIGPGEAADALEKQFYNWRGDGREPKLRMRVVALRASAGQFRQALALLRETEAGWPDQAPAIRARRGDVFSALLRGEDAKPISPLDLVTLAEDNADVMPDGAAGEKLAALLADKLAALDLPRRAVPVMRRLMQAASGAAKAAYGAHLAGMQLRDGDADSARRSLASSDADGLAPELATTRALLQAKALAQLGKASEATDLLAGLDDPQAAELRADIAEQAKDWEGAETALRALAARKLPLAGDLDAGQQSLVLRLAGAASQAGDSAALADLRQHESKRMAQGKLADMFRLLTAAPVRSTADLPRAAAEATLARAIPADLQALRTP